MNRKLLLAPWLGGIVLALAANASQAQSYFYGYYYPEENKFVSSKLNIGMYEFSTVTPMWNAIHGGQYIQGRGQVPTGTPLYGPTYPSRIMPSGTGGYSTAPSPNFGQPVSTASAPVTPQANVRVLVPEAQAVVYIGDYQTKSTGTERVFQSPALNPGEYKYHIKVAYTQGGQQLVQERTIAVSPGRSFLVDFTDGTTTATILSASDSLSRVNR